MFGTGQSSAHASVGKTGGDFVSCHVFWILLSRHARIYPLVMMVPDLRRGDALMVAAEFHRWVGMASVSAGGLWVSA